MGNAGSDCNPKGTEGVTSQKGVIDAAVPVTVCDVIVEIVGNSNSNCSQSPDTTTQSGTLADVYAPATACGVIAEVDGTATGVCTGPGNRTPIPTGTPDKSGTGVTPPITICGIEAALGGLASATCPRPTTSASSPPSTSPSNTSPTTVPVSLASTSPAPAKTAAAAAASGPLAFTGAPLLLELLIGAMALLTGLVISKLARRQRGGVPGASFGA
jgi:hypothetical protein